MRMAPRGSSLDVIIFSIYCLAVVSSDEIEAIQDVYNNAMKPTNVTYTFDPVLKGPDADPGGQERWRYPNVPSYTKSVPDEQRLMQHLFGSGYEKTVRPVRNASTPVVIRMGLTFTQIFDMDEKDQVLVTNVWLDQEWMDEFMFWEPAEFANITTLRVPCTKLWLPDIVLYNNAAEYTDGLMPANAMVRYDGNIFWPVPTKLQSSCKVDVTYFPFDRQTCKMKFGSWTYDGFQVDITNRTEEVDLSNYVNNGEWELISIKIVRNVVVYACCPEPFPDVTFTIKIRRRTLYYMYNVIFPCIMMSALTLLVFCLPPDSGEKIALGITVLLAFSVFMLAVAENLPETSEFVPLISIYLTIVMALTSMSVIMTVFVLNLHHRGPNRRQVPRWLKELLIHRMSPYLCLQEAEVEEPGRYYNTEERFIKNVSLRITLDNIQQALQNETQIENNRYDSAGNSPRASETQVNCVSQTTVRAVVEPQVQNTAAINNQINQNSQHAQLANRPVEHVYPTVQMASQPNSNTSSNQQFYHNSNTHAPQAQQVHPRTSGVIYHQAQPTPASSSNAHENHRRSKRRSNTLTRTNEEILTSLKRILEKHEKEDRDYEVVQDWQRIAQCMDRVLFFIFLFATMTSTVGVLVIAPASQ